MRCLPLPFPYFNHSVVPILQGGYLFASRGSVQGNRTLWFGRSDDRFQLLWDYVCSDPGNLLGGMHDPRLHWQGECLKIIFSFRSMSRCRLAAGEIDVNDEKRTVRMNSIVKLPAFQSQEKNWIPWRSEYFYDLDRGVRLRSDFTLTDPVDPPLGIGLKGGTNFVSIGDLIIGVAHNWRMNTPGSTRRTYEAFVLLLEATVPNRVRGVAAIDTREIRADTPIQRQGRWAREHLESVVFPMSIIICKDVIQVLSGINDTRSAIIELDRAEVDAWVSERCRKL